MEADSATALLQTKGGVFRTIAFSANELETNRRTILSRYPERAPVDSVALGPRFELRNNPVSVPENTDVYTPEKDIIAPGPGTFVAMHDGVPDDTPVDLLMQGMSDPVHSMSGNRIMIDHGDGEVIALFGGSQPTGYLHLHCQLQTSADLKRTDGMQARFDTIELAFATMGARVSIPEYGSYLQTTHTTGEGM